MRAWRVALLGFAACGLFPDVASLSGSDAGDAAVEDVVVLDAPQETSEEAAVDAPSDASDASVSPCASQHLFCDDFDQTALGALWDEKVLKSGPLALSSTSVVTPPNALEATAITNGSGDETALGKHFPAADHTHVEFDLLVVSPSDTSGTELDVADLVLDTPPSGYDYADFDLQRWQGATQLEEYMQGADGGPNGGQDLPVTETFASWRHVALDLDFPNQTFSLALDGASVTSFAMSPAAPKCGFSLYVGVGYVEGANDDWNVFVDDVVVDQQ